MRLSPALDANFDTWAEYVWERENPRGRHLEHWQHSYGCRQFLKIDRDMVSHEIFQIEPVGPYAPGFKNMSGYRLESGGLIDRSKAVKFRFDGKAFSGFEGDTLAAALLASEKRFLHAVLSITARVVLWQLGPKNQMR